MKLALTAAIAALFLVAMMPTASAKASEHPCNEPWGCVCISNGHADCGPDQNALFAVYVFYNNGPLNVTVCIDSVHPICDQPVNIQAS